MAALVSTRATVRRWGGSVWWPVLAAWQTTTFLAVVVWGVACWWGRYLRYVAVVAVVGLAATLAVPLVFPGLGHPVAWVRAVTGVLVVGPAVVSVVWKRWWPFRYEVMVAQPFRQWTWRRWARKSWGHLCREAGLSVQRTESRQVVRKQVTHEGTRYVRETEDVPVWVHPPLMDVTTQHETLRLTVHPRTGQTVDEVEAAVARIAPAARAFAYRSTVENPWTIHLDLIMREYLDTVRVATIPAAVDARNWRDRADELRRIPLGRVQDGTRCVLDLGLPHVLIAGATGAGKGSVQWSIIGALAPWVALDMVRLWGADLKYGMEMAMGADLFTELVTTPEATIAMLNRLIAVMDERGRAMAGQQRDHQPSPGDPLHVLVIDELAMLVAYCAPELRRVLVDLITQILSKGRALGILVIASVQDPRKEVVSFRDHFSQVIAMRLSLDAARMVLKDAVDQARTDRLTDGSQGTGFIVTNTGGVRKFRADYWPDTTLRALARTYPAPVVHVDFTPDDTVTDDDTAPGTGSTPWTEREAPTRKPRQPRKPRAPRAPRRGTTTGGQEDAA